MKNIDELEHVATENFKLYENEWLNGEFSLSELSENFWENRSELDIDRDDKNEYTEEDYNYTVINAASSYFENTGDFDLKCYYRSVSIGGAEEALESYKAETASNNISKVIAEEIMESCTYEDRAFFLTEAGTNNILN